jgi:Flp pilus assembly protein TadD
MGRGYVNLSREAGLEYAARAYQGQQDGRAASAVELCRRALTYDDRQAGWWYNLGLTSQKLGREKQARDAYGRAAALEPREAQFRVALRSLGRPAEG